MDQHRRGARLRVSKNLVARRRADPTAADIAADVAVPHFTLDMWDHHPAPPGWTGSEFQVDLLPDDTPPVAGEERPL